MKVFWQEGQASILKSPNPGEEENQFFVTTLHNMTSELNKKGELVTCIGHMLHLPGADDAENFEVNFTDCGLTISTDGSRAMELRDGHYWNTGYEICRGPPADIRSLIGDDTALNFRGKVEPVEIVDGNFEYVVGMKVAISVYTTSKTTLTQMPKIPELQLSVTKRRGLLSLICSNYCQE